MKNYFPHDFNARNDYRLVNVMMKYGCNGIGLYWCIIEMLYECNGYIMLSECDRIAFEMRVDLSLISDLINGFGLFKKDKNKFWSESALQRIEIIKSKSEKAKQSASARWKDTNGMRTHSERNAIKEKEIKEKEIKEDIPKVEDWRSNFEIYKRELRSEYNKLINDPSWVSGRQKFHPFIDILLSIEKCCVDFWATEEGWNFKKKSKIKKINWKSTLEKALSLKINQVPLPFRVQEEKKETRGAAYKSITEN